jgi:hypothetical protein
MKGGGTAAADICSGREAAEECATALAATALTNEKEPRVVANQATALATAVLANDEKCQVEAK